MASTLMQAVFDVDMNVVDFGEVITEFGRIEGFRNISQPGGQDARVLTFHTTMTRAQAQQAVNDHPDHLFRGCYVSEVLPNR